MNEKIENIRYRIRRFKNFPRWFLFLFLRAPMFELYIAKMNRLNEKFFKKVKEDIAKSKDSQTCGYKQQEIPKKIWFYWAQGLDSAPKIVKTCIQSWRIKNPGWEATVLNDSIIETYVDVSDIPSFLPVRMRANIIRLRLLIKYGGVWADATTYCHRPLDSWLPLLAYTGFFTFSNPAPDRNLENWFIVSSKGNFLTKEWESIYASYCRRLKFRPGAYFIAYYSFQWKAITNKEFLAESRKCSTIAAPLTLFLMSYLEGRTPLEEVKNVISAGLPVSKLNWKTNDLKNDIDETLSSIENTTNTELVKDLESYA